jgi:hypothetical protein
MTASPQAPFCGEESHERSRSSATGTGIAYSEAFAEVLAERPSPLRAKPALRLTEDSRHASTLLSASLVCVLAAATFIALWQSLTVGMVAPDGAFRGVSMQPFVRSSFSNSPAPVRSVIDALQSDANVLIKEVRTLNIATAGVLTYTGQAWAQSAGQSADTETNLQSSAEAVPVAQVALDQEPTMPQPVETGVQTSPVPMSSVPYKTEKDSGSQYWSMTSVNTASAPVSAPTSQASVDASMGASDSSGSSVDETAKAKGTRKEAHTSRSDSKGSSKSKSGKDRNSTGSSGGKSAKADSHSHADASHSKDGGDRGKAGKDHKGGDKGKKKD